MFEIIPAGLIARLDPVSAVLFGIVLQNCRQIKKRLRFLEDAVYGENDGEDYEKRLSEHRIRRDESTLEKARRRLRVGLGFPGEPTRGGNTDQKEG